MAEKKNILTYAGLKQYEDELHDLKVNKRREISRRMQSTMRPRMSRGTLRRGSRRSKSSLKTLRS